MPRDVRSQGGFSLPEVMIAMGIMLVVLGGTFTAMTNAMRSEKAARDVTSMNGNLRAAMDLIVRDLLQAGQGLPVGRRIGVPHGPGSVPIVRPGPGPAGACPGVDEFPVDPSIPAISVGPDLGPPVNGQCTDVITILAADGAFEGVNVSSIASNGRSLTVYPFGVDRIPGNADDTDIDDDPDVLGDNIRVGDLLMITKGANSTLVFVTGVSGQRITFNPGDPLNLNQFDTGLNMLGTVNQSKADAPADPSNPVVQNGVEQPGPSTVTRIRMITYFVDSTTTPNRPRLMRVVGGGVPNVVSFDVEAFRITYDINDGLNSATNVRMVPADLAPGGACGAIACSENQIKKANVVLSLRSQDRHREIGNFYQNTLFTQVALRSLAFVDRYR